MATMTLCKTYEAMKEAGDWINSVTLAHESKCGRRRVQHFAQFLVDEELAELKTVDRTKYYRLLPVVENNPVILDINETLRIKK